MIGDRLYRYPPVRLPVEYAEAERGYAGALLTNGLQSAYFAAQHQNNLILEQFDRLDQVVIGNREAYGAGLSTSPVILARGLWEGLPGFNVLVGRVVIIAARSGLFRLRVRVYDDGSWIDGDWSQTRIEAGTLLPYLRGIGSQGAANRPLDVFDIFPDTCQIVETELSIDTSALVLPMQIVQLEAFFPAVEGDPDPASIAFNVLYRHVLAESRIE